MEESIEEKQQFLREMILEKGYDINIFIDFLKHKKGGEEGADISSWSMKDLQNVVQEFVSLDNYDSIPRSQQNEQNINEEKNDSKINKTDVEPGKNDSNPSQKETQLKTNDIEQNKKSFDNKNQSKAKDNKQTNAKTTEKKQQTNKLTDDLINLKEEDFGIIIPDFTECKKQENFKLLDDNKLEITVNDPKKVDKGFFSKAYIDFAITTNPCNLKVRRQHAEFVWLRERLSVIYNTNILPRLPKKGKVNADPHIEKRMRNLEKFLNYLIKDPLIKNSQILYDFLSIEKEEDFNKKKKIYNKMKTPVELNDIKSIDGKIKIKITKNREANIENIKDNAALNETAFKKLNTNFKSLREDMNTIISRVLSFSPLFDKLIKISKTYSEDAVITESYQQMKNLFLYWGDILKKQNSFFCNDVKEYFKLIGGNYHHLRDLAQVVENLKSSYYK